MIFILTKYNVFAYCGGTGTKGGLSAPDRAVFLCLPRREILPIWRVDRAEYNTCKGNKPSRPLATVETRHLSNVAKSLKPKEAQMKKPEAPNPEISKMFIRMADLSHVWDCRCEIEKFSQCITAVHMLASDYLNADAMAPFCVLLCLFAEKLDECNELLSKTLDQALEAKQ